MLMRLASSAILALGLGCGSASVHLN